MNKVLPVFLLMGILLLGSVSPSIVFAQSEKVDVLIGFNGKPDVSLVNQHGGKVKDNFYPFINALSAELPSAAIQGLENNPKIDYIEFDLIATAHNHWSCSGEYCNVWGVDHIDSDVVHASGLKGEAVNVVVIDTGINGDHKDLADNYKGGKDYVNGDNDPSDDHGHGSHVSGTIAGVEGNGHIIGVAPKINLWGVKVLNSAGSGSYSNVINGINWAALNGMDVANLSLGGGFSQTLCDAVESAFINYDVLIVASAGNSGYTGRPQGNVGYPAGCDYAIAVAATDQNDLRASFSSVGSQVEISAPGVGIYSSTLDDGFGTWSGTSMAAPHVSGVAALVKNADSSLGPADIRSILQTTAIPLGAHKEYGYGFVNTLGAIEAATGGESIPATPSPDFTISADPSSITANIGSVVNSIITITPSDGMQSVDLSAPSATFDPSTVDVHEGPAISTMTYTVSNTPGDYQLVVTGVGDGEVEHTTTINLDVIDPDAVTPTEVSVADITYNREGGRNNDKHLIISVFLLNDLLDPVNGAEVTINLECDCSKIGWAGTVTSDSSGIATFQLSNAKPGTYTTTVTSVVAEGLAFDPEDPNNTYSKTSSKSNQNQ